MQFRNLTYKHTYLDATVVMIRERIYLIVYIDEWLQMHDTNEHHPNQLTYCRFSGDMVNYHSGESPGIYKM